MIRTTAFPIPIGVARKLPWNKLMDYTEAEIQAIIAISSVSERQGEPVDAVGMIENYLRIFHNMPNPNWLTGQVLDALAVNQTL